jgi:hypothetical protein
MNQPIENDLRLIEAGFPCHQVGARTQRERGAAAPSRLSTFSTSGGPAGHWRLP